ncbi:hypothetical protein [Cellulomonas endophytica]|uniref:hypothetical protein n=1 Tax=Cellulomonas endophytica TaxID=2494735 RepID=UPI0010108D48|nr:hypothetical protein [Cellulomonas endophytica]
MRKPSDAGRSPVGTAIAEALNPVMTAAGFAPGQSGEGPTGAAVVYCSPHAHFRSRYPHLAVGVDNDDPGACTNLNVYVDLLPEPHISEAHLDGVPLQQQLRETGHDDLIPQLATWASRPASDALPELESVLEAVFSRR